MLKIKDYEKGYSGSPVITQHCTVAALTSSFSDGDEFSDEEQKFLADKYLKLREQLKNSSTPPSNELNRIIFRYVRDEQIVKVVPIVCIMHKIIEARYNNNIPTFESNSQILGKLLKAMNGSAINNSILIAFKQILESKDLTWTDLVELERTLSYHQNEISIEDAYLLRLALYDREKEIHSGYISTLSLLVSKNIENQSNTITPISANSSLSSTKYVAETLVSNANNTKITTETLPQIMPDGSENFGKDLSLEDKIKVAKKLEDYLTGKIPWPAKATSDFKRLVADTALSHAASAYLAANDLKDPSMVADSLEVIGTIINYGSKKAVLSEERYQQKANVGNIIYLNGEMARSDLSSLR